MQEERGKKNRGGVNLLGGGLTIPAAAPLSLVMTYACSGPAGCVGGSGCSMSCRGCRGGGGSSWCPGPSGDGCSSALLLQEAKHVHKVNHIAPELEKSRFHSCG